MTCLATMPRMSTRLDDRMRLVGRIVRDGITDTGKSYSQAAREWPISLPTLNRLMSTGNVGVRFYRVAEHNLGLPPGFLEMVIDGNVGDIEDLGGLNERIRRFVLTELADPPKNRRKQA